MPINYIPFKDLIVAEQDGKTRVNLVRKDGSILETDILLQISSEILQVGDKFGAKELNSFLDKDEQGNLYPKLQTKERI